MNVLDRHIRLHKDFRCKLDSDYLLMTKIGYNEEDEEHRAWSSSAHVDLFVDEEGVWLLPADECPLGNGAVLPVYTIEGRPEVFEEIFYAMYAASTLFNKGSKTIINLERSVKINNILVSSLVFDSDNGTVTGGGSQQYSLENLRMRFEQFEDLIKAVLEVQIF